MAVTGIGGFFFRSNDPKDAALYQAKSEGRNRVVMAPTIASVAVDGPISTAARLPTLIG